MSPRVITIESSNCWYRGRQLGFDQRRAFAGPQVLARDVAALRLAIDDVRVGRVLRREESVAASEGEPVRVRDWAALRRLGPHHEPLSCTPPQTLYGTGKS